MARAPTAWGSATGTTTPSLLLALLHLHPRWEPGAFSPTALHLRRAGPGADAAGWHAAVPGALQEAEPSAPGAAPGQQPASPSRGACTTRGVVLGSQLSSLPAPLQTHGQELQQAEVSAGCRGGEGGLCSIAHGALRDGDMGDLQVAVGGMVKSQWSSWDMQQLQAPGFAHQLLVEDGYVAAPCS